MVTRMDTWDQMFLQTGSCNQWHAKHCWPKGHCWSSSSQKWMVTSVNGLLTFAKPSEPILHPTSPFERFFDGYYSSHIRLLYPRIYFSLFLKVISVFFEAHHVCQSEGCWNNRQPCWWNMESWLAWKRRSVLGFCGSTLATTEACSV